MTREVFFPGSVPNKPASALFDAFVEHGLARKMKYVPDGEQEGWGGRARARIAALPFLENSRVGAVTGRQTTLFFANRRFQYSRVREGHNLSDMDTPDLGLVNNAIQSYREFKRVKDAGGFSADTKFVVTIPGPGTLFFTIEAPKEQLFPFMERTFKQEISRIVGALPPTEIAIQLDLALEAELEEYLRRPDAFELPFLEGLDWSLHEQTQMVANICNSIPREVDLGFHLCAIFHIDQSQGQDMNVHVDWCNALSDKIERPVNYIHLPTVPQHGDEDFETLLRLRLKPETKIYLGLMHTDDWLEGAKRRSAAAAKVYPNFGVATFCGLSQPSRHESVKPRPIGDILNWHREVAEL
jgi:hypothetical protein